MAKKLISPNQMSFDIEILAQAQEKDRRPHPVIISTKWNFPLTYVDTDGNADNYLYCARDWYIGLGGDKSNWSNHKNDWLSSVQPVMIETKRERRAPEMLEYVDQYGLYRIAQVMKPRKGETALGEIQAYLAMAGVFVGQLARGNKNATRMAKKLISKSRQDGIAERKNFTATARAKHIKNNPPIGLMTNTIYSKLFNLGNEYTAKKMIIAELGLSDKHARNLRDNFSDLANDAIRMAETASIRAMENRPNLMTDAEMLYTVKQCARIVAVPVRQLAEFAGVDLLSDKPLLSSGKDKQ